LEGRPADGLNNVSVWHMTKNPAGGTRYNRKLTVYPDSSTSSSSQQRLKATQTFEGRDSAGTGQTGWNLDAAGGNFPVITPYDTNPVYGTSFANNAPYGYGGGAGTIRRNDTPDAGWFWIFYISTDTETYSINNLAATNTSVGPSVVSIGTMTSVLDLFGSGGVASSCYICQRGNVISRTNDPAQVSSINPEVLDDDYVFGDTANIAASEFDLACAIALNRAPSPLEWSLLMQGILPDDLGLQPLPQDFTAFFGSYDEVVSTSGVSQVVETGALTYYANPADGPTLYRLES
jgi:hypothetical protein